MKESIKIGDVVLLNTTNTNWSECPMARVVQKMQDNDGLVRSVKLHIGSKNSSDQTLIRPITKLVLLVRNEDV